MKQSLIEEFGKIIVQRVRDTAVNSCDQQLEPKARGPVARRWRERSGDPQTLIPDCVDETIFQFLTALDQGIIKLSFTSSSGESVDLNQDGMGELAGLFMASGGWRSDYATKRFNDDFSDLA